MSNDVKLWSTNQESFQAWLALPEQNREPVDQTALAAEMNVRPETLSRWKRLDGFMEEVTRKARAST